MLQGQGSLLSWPLSFGVVVNSITGRFFVDIVVLIRCMRASRRLLLEAGKTIAIRAPPSGSAAPSGNSEKNRDT